MDQECPEELMAFSEEGDFHVEVLQDDTYISQEPTTKRVYHNLVFDAGKAGKITCTASLPEDIPRQGLPAIVILVGLNTGRQALDYIPDHQNFAMIAYEYPEVLHGADKASVLLRLKEAKKGLYSVPTQILTLCQWVSKQSWSDDQPPAVMGFSFGAEFLPAIYHLARHYDISLGPGIIGYAGVNIRKLLYANLQKAFILRPLFALWGAYLCRALEPAIHIPHMKGNFLVVNGLGDERIPADTAYELQKMVPEPKKVINLDTKHINPQKKEMLKEVVGISKAWLYPLMHLN
ncbi:MAG: alpha/beta hydrolase family protein [Chlamydiota bacterium]